MSTPDKLRLQIETHKSELNRINEAKKLIETMIEDARVELASQLFKVRPEQTVHAFHSVYDHDELKGAEKARVISIIPQYNDEKPHLIVEYINNDRYTGQYNVYTYWELIEDCNEETKGYESRKVD